MRITRWSFAGLLAAAVMLPVWGWCQAPDVTQNQVTGVDQSKFFYLGPTGMKGWMYWSSLTSEARQILVTDVPTNAPAFGVVTNYDVILGIGGNLFTNDARAAFVDAVVDAEATGNNGELYLTVFTPTVGGTTNTMGGVTNTLMVQIKEMGTRNQATTPYDCPWVDGVLSNFCEYIYNNGIVGQPTVEPSIWAMLASGEPKYVDWAENYITNQSYATRTTLDVYRDTDQKVWYTGYQLITLCQYYLLTSNNLVLPAIENTANFIAEGQDRHGLWGHTMAWPAQNGGQLHGSLPGYGALNQAGLAGLYGLALAQKCGVSDPEVDAAVDKAAHFFRSHMYLGAIDYGYAKPAYGVTDSNGRMGIAAHLFRALGEPEVAKWYAMMTATYKWRDWGHTGNQFNHCWGPTAGGVGGPLLANFVQTERETQGPYWLVSLVNRFQPEGYFLVQGQEGRGNGYGTHVTGGYGIQLAANRSYIEITGAGYNTNDYWLTSAELDEVAFAITYEAGDASPAGLTTPELLTNLNSYCPKVAYKLADELGLRAMTNATLLATLIDIVEDPAKEDRERVAALKALNKAETNSLVAATTDQWFYPSQGYVLNLGAAQFAAADTVVTWTNVLAAMLEFNLDLGFDNKTVEEYSRRIYNMDLSLLDAAGSNLYYEAAGIILDPDVGGNSWIGNQDVQNWDPLIIARYADSILRAAELRDSGGYSPTDILSHNQIGEGMHCAMVRSTDYTAFRPGINTGAVEEYGQNWGWYLDYTHALKQYTVRTGANYKERYVTDLVCEQPVPPVLWFRYLIATNIANTLTNPATMLADLRYNMTVGEDDDLFHAVCLDEIVSHPDNVDPFVDITNSLGFTTPTVGSHWRLHAGAVELGVADTNAVDRWLVALAEADAAGNDLVIGGILHVLAGKAAPEALAPATNYLLHANDYVAMAALNVLEAVGTQNELLMVFDNFLTNSLMVVSDDSGEGYVTTPKSGYWTYAHWRAITNIVGRDYQGCLTNVADQLASSFMAYTLDGVEADKVVKYASARTRPFSILDPVLSQREVMGGYGENGVFAVLGIFSRDNASCLGALVAVEEYINEGNQFNVLYSREEDYTACVAMMAQYTISELIAKKKAGDPVPWNNRSLSYYLIDNVVMEKVAASNQLDALTVVPHTPYYWEAFSTELGNRRGLQETEGTFFFSID